jgi:hypothetical protein
VAAPPTGPTAAAPKAPAARPKTPTVNTGAVDALEQLHLTPEEIKQATRWAEKHVPPDVILERIVSSRKLTQATKTSTPDQAAEAVRYRNEKGRWKDE